MGTLYSKTDPDEKTVLKKSLGGGPLGLGDPDDRTLRVVEREVLISKMVRERIRQEKCKGIGDAMEKCGAENGFMVIFNCRNERDALYDCSKKWFDDEGLRNECTEEFLRQRSYYRRTGQRGHLHRMEGSVHQA